MNKPTLEAIKQGYPMRWEADGVGGFGVKLVATTYTWENGKVRERTLWRTFDRSLAVIHHGQIHGFGGKVSGPGPDRVYDEWRQRQQDREWEERMGLRR